MNQILVIAGGLLAFGILIWVLVRVSKAAGRKEARLARAEDAERIKDEQIKIAARRPRSVGELLRIMRGKRS
jgi:uncharacterized membrane protein